MIENSTAGIVSVGTYSPETTMTAAEIAETSGLPDEVHAEFNAGQRLRLPMVAARRSL